MTVETRAMSSRILRIVAMLVILASLLVGRQAAAFHEETLIDDFLTSSYAEGYASRTDGETVVWNARVSSDDPDDPDQLFVMGARIADRQPSVIAETSWLPTAPDIDGDIVVWGESENDTAGTIRGKNLATGEEFTIASSEPGVDSVSVSDGWVVWRTTTGVSPEIVSTIKMHNLSENGETVTLAETAPGPDGPTLGVPKIDAGWIVWADQYNPAWTGFARLVARRASDDSRIVSINVEHIRRYDLSGAMIAYPAPSGAPTMATTVRDLDTGQTRTITMSIPAPYLSGGDHLAFDGRYVFRSYVTRLGGSSGQDYQLLAYDLTTDSVFPIILDTSYTLDVEDGVLTWFPGCLCAYRAVHATTIADRLPTAPVLDTRPPDPGWVYQPESSHYLQYGFKGFWEGNGGLPVFGYPLTEEYIEQNDDTGAFYTVQYFERQRYEYHPENAGTAYEVLLGRLGAQLLTMQGRDWTTFLKADPNAPNYISETGHAIAPEFADYWQRHGLDLGDDGLSYRESVALFGYPLSEPSMETNTDGDTVLTQYFERAVFEYHPNNPAEHQVLLRRVGAEVLDARGW